MDAEQTPLTTRDRDLRRTRRLRAGMVSAGVVGSLGVAGVVGYAAVNAAGTTAATGSPAGSSAGTLPGTVPGSTGSGDDGDTFTFPQQLQQQSGEDDGGEGDDDGFGQLPQSGLGGQSQANPFAGQAPPQLQQGFGGGPQAGTSGS